MLNRKLWIGLGFALLMIVIGACVPADASKAISRSQIESGQIVPAEESRVAEYLQYYKQNFPQPVNTTLGLDLRLGNAQVPVEGGTAWLQIGIQAKSSAGEDIAPLNLALVIDRSGSMDSPEKMPYLKESLCVFLRSLASNDIVALVVFSDRAELLVPGNKVGDGAWIENAINRLQPGGSTNLYDGLMMGFREVDRNFDVRRNNRIILLTDGIANVGTTDLNTIANAARAYNDKGIYLSAIGLGKDFNDPLLSTLAKQGKGGYHFIDSAQEMDKVFCQEASGMMQKAVSDVSVVITPASGVSVDASRLSNYDPTWDVEVLRNVTIQRTAEGLKEIDRLYKAQRYQDAWNVAYRLEQDLRTVARLTNEAQMVKDADLTRTYQDTLSNWVQRQTGRPPQYSDGGGYGSDTGQPTRARQVLPTPSAPVIEIK